MRSVLLTVFVTTIAASACGVRSESSSTSATNPALHRAERSVYLAFDQTDLDAGLNIAKNYGAGLTINFAKKEVKINIITCPPTALCQILGPEYSAKIVSDSIISQGGCSDRVIRARTDLRPVDGALTEITVVDQSQNECRLPTTSRNDFKTEATLVTKIVSRRDGTEHATRSEFKSHRSILLENNRPRACTMVAGVLVNPRTGRCESYTNGCQLSEMRAAGFRFPEQSECFN